MKTIYSFNKQQRLLKSVDFSYLKVKSYKIKTALISAYFKKSRTESQNTRIGISISKKWAKAHERNAIRRIIREEFRLSQMKNLGLDILFVIHFSLKENFLWKKEIRNQLTWLLSEIKKTTA